MFKDSLFYNDSINNYNLYVLWTILIVIQSFGSPLFFEGFENITPLYSINSTTSGLQIDYGLYSILGMKY